MLFVYLDDIIIFSDTYDEHIQFLTNVFERLSKYHLIINIEKSNILVQKTYLCRI